MEIERNHGLANIIRIASSTSTQRPNHQEYFSKQPPHAPIIMQCTKLITRNISPALPRKQPQKSRPVLIKADNPKVPTHNPTPDSDQLAYRLCELSLQKMQKEALASEPDLRHFLASSSMQKMAQQGLLHRLDALHGAVPLYSMPLLPGADEPLLSEDEIWDMKELELAASELEKASRKSEIARLLCFQHAREM